MSRVRVTYCRVTPQGARGVHMICNVTFRLLTVENGHVC